MKTRLLFPTLRRVLLIALLTLPLSGAFRVHGQGKARLEAIPDVDKWITTHFAKGKVPPFSFLYDSVPSRQFITRWNYTGEKLESGKYLYTYKDPASGLKIECTVTGWRDYNAVEWVMRLTNTGPENTPMLDRFMVVDQAYEQKSAGTPSVLHALGSVGGRFDFMVSKTELTPDTLLHMAPQGGRSSDGTAFPFFSLLSASGQQGIVAAVGWTGGWQADLSAADGRSISLQSGMDRFSLYLKPGETIRTPMICLVSWEGEDLMAGQNKFRRFLLSHHSRQIDGEFAKYPYASGFPAFGPAPCTEGGCLTEEMDIALMRRMKMFDIVPGIFWLDAGWYTDSGAPVYDWCDIVGSWTPDTTRYPRGIKPVADEAHRLGAKFLLWFEPERVSRGSWLAREHQPWLLHSKVRNSALLDLGNAEALDWLCNHVGDMIEEVGIDIYRQDFNHPAGPFWEENDEPGRIGMLEIRHIEGLYKFWDYLLERFPRILLDNCAAGGRRIDIEMMSRSVPLWRTDYPYSEVTGKQSHAYGLNFWLPQHGTGSYEVNDYAVRSSLSACVTTLFDITSNGPDRLKVSDIQHAIATFNKYQPYYYEDYYPLTGVGIDTQPDDIWLAYQMHRPSDNSGIVVAFRREESRVDRIRVSLGGVDPRKEYTLYDDNTKMSQQISGSQLIDGIYLNISQRRGSLLLHYTLAQ